MSNFVHVKLCDCDSRRLKLIIHGLILNDYFTDKCLGEKLNNDDDPHPLLIRFKENTACISMDPSQMKIKKEEDLRKEAERLNGLLSKNDAQNWRYKVCVGIGLVRFWVEERRGSLEGRIPMGEAGS